MVDFTVIIPARYGSTRFPGKPLALIHGKPMIQHVHSSSLASGASRVVVATDDARIAERVKSFGGELCMTSPNHASGTERLSEVIETLGLDEDEIVVNVQGDEPFIPPANIAQVARNLAQSPKLPMATLAYPIADISDVHNPNVVKVVTDQNKRALYFSRSAIPFDREQQLHASDYLRHIGIYAYRAGFIQQYIKMPVAPLETIESLEQLRVLYNGYQIHTDTAIEAPPHGVDTPEDLARFN